MSRRTLQVALGILATVATTMGSSGVLRGTAEVPDGGPVSANVDSEYRFYATWYLVLGLLLFRAARRPEEEAVVVRACGAGLLVAAGGRALSIRKLGHPHRFQQVLMALELLIPALLVPWHRSVLAASSDQRRD